jgi:hypothetical protein
VIQEDPTVIHKVFVVDQRGMEVVEYLTNISVHECFLLQNMQYKHRMRNTDLVNEALSI